MITILSWILGVPKEQVEILALMEDDEQKKVARRLLGLSVEDVNNIKRFNNEPIEFSLSTLKMTKGEYLLIKSEFDKDNFDDYEFRDYLRELREKRPTLPKFGGFLKECHHYLDKRDSKHKNPLYWRGISPKSHIKAARDLLDKMLTEERIKVSHIYAIIGFLYYALYNLYKGDTGDFLD